MIKKKQPKTELLFIFTNPNIGIFEVENKNEIKIVRILHQQMDIDAQLNN